MNADSNSSTSKIIVVVRKRPLSKKEVGKGETDIIEVRDVNQFHIAKCIGVVLFRFVIIDVVLI